MENPKMLIAMSGGVDSSVAAYLMQQAGYICAGATMKMQDPMLLKNPDSNQQDAQDAAGVAEALGMPFYILDASKAFCAQVVEPFVRCYEQGGTPNPCVGCNRHLKFGFFLEKALEMGFTHVVTGHYAKITIDPESGRYLLQRAKDAGKDQSYFLASLTQKQLSHICFPLGELTKEQTREIAEKQGFLNARKKDSQDICFIPDGDYVAFMQRYQEAAYPPGDYLDLQGKIVGKHQGAVSYTIGQRKGLGLAMGEPVYVCCKDMAANTVTVGPEEALFRKGLRADDWNWFPFAELVSPIRVTAKIRYRHKEQPATVYPEESGFCRVEFDEPQRAITTGQAVVLYDGDTVIGGGTIQEVL